GLTEPGRERLSRHSLFILSVLIRQPRIVRLRRSHYRQALADGPKYLRGAQAEWLSIAKKQLSARSRRPLRKRKIVEGIDGPRRLDLRKPDDARLFADDRLRSRGGITETEHRDRR